LWWVIILLWFFSVWHWRCRPICFWVGPKDKFDHFVAFYSSSSLDCWVIALRIIFTWQHLFQLAIYLQQWSFI
jgi:hypothetical protein